MVGTKKVIVLFGFFLAIIGTGVALYLSQNSAEIRQQAAVSVMYGGAGASCASAAQCASPLVCIGGMCATAGDPRATCLAEGMQWCASGHCVTQSSTCPALPSPSSVLSASPTPLPVLPSPSPSPAGCDGATASRIASTCVAGQIFNTVTCGCVPAPTVVPTMSPPPAPAPLPPSPVVPTVPSPTPIQITCDGATASRIAPTCAAQGVGFNTATCNCYPVSAPTPPSPVAPTIPAPTTKPVAVVPSSAPTPQQSTAPTIPSSTIICDGATAARIAPGCAAAGVGFNSSTCTCTTPAPVPSAPAPVVPTISATTPPLTVAEINALTAPTPPKPVIPTIAQNQSGCDGATASRIASSCTPGQVFDALSCTCKSQLAALSGPSAGGPVVPQVAPVSQSAPFVFQTSPTTTGPTVGTGPVVPTATLTTATAPVNPLVAIFQPLLDPVIQPFKKLFTGDGTIQNPGLLSISIRDRLQKDNKNCGTPGNVCNSFETCRAGQCIQDVVIIDPKTGARTTLALNNSSLGLSILDGGIVNDRVCPNTPQVSNCTCDEGSLANTGEPCPKGARVLWVNWVDKSKPTSSFANYLAGNTPDKPDTSTGPTIFAGLIQWGNRTNALLANRDKLPFGDFLAAAAYQFADLGTLGMVSKSNEAVAAWLQCNLEAGIGQRPRGCGKETIAAGISSSGLATSLTNLFFAARGPVTTEVGVPTTVTPLTTEQAAAITDGLTVGETVTVDGEAYVVQSGVDGKAILVKSPVAEPVDVAEKIITGTDGQLCLLTGGANSQIFAYKNNAEDTRVLGAVTHSLIALGKCIVFPKSTEIYIDKTSSDPSYVGISKVLDSGYADPANVNADLADAVRGLEGKAEKSLMIVGHSTTDGTSITGIQIAGKTVTTSQLAQTLVEDGLPDGTTIVLSSCKSGCLINDLAKDLAGLGKKNIVIIAPTDNVYITTGGEFFVANDTGKVVSTDNFVITTINPKGQVVSVGTTTISPRLQK